MRPRLCFIAVLVALTPLTPMAAHGQEATPDASPSLTPLLQQVVAAAQANDGPALAALYADDGTHADVPAGVEARGREEIAAYIDGVGEQVEDLWLEPVTATHEGDLAVLEYIFSGTDAATGQPFAIPGVLIFTLDGAVIRRSVDYYDSAAFLAQIGLLETDEATAATPAP